MIPYLGDFAEDETVYIYFNTFSSNDPSASVTVTDLIASDIFVYKDGSVTDLVTDGASVTVDFDSRTGVHKIEIDTSVHADYTTGSDYMVCIVGATVDAGTINAAIACFSIENRYSAGALRPTTAGRTLDVSAGGEAGIDWANIGSPTTAQNLSGTNIDTDQVVASVTGATGSVTAGVTLAAGAITDASLAGNMETVFETDFATNYNATRSAWATNVQDTVGTGNLPADAVSISGDTTTADNLQVLFDGNEGFYSAYFGPRGPGVYLNDAAANTSTTNGVDGTIGNPVSTIAAAKTIADSMSLDRIYIFNDSAITLAATMEDYEFVGIGEPGVNSVALASQDVDQSSFFNLTITGVQGGSQRARFEDCIFGTATIYPYALRCGFTDSVTGVTFSNNDDVILDSCFSMVAGNSTPIFILSGANLDVSFRHYSGGVQFNSATATTTCSVETDGQVIVDATCNSAFALTVRGMCNITDNASLSSLTRLAAYDQDTAVDAVWDETLADHLTAGSTGAGLNSASSAGDPWATALPGAYGAGTAGKIIGDNIDAPLSTIDTVVDGIQADLDNGTDGLGAIKAETALIVADTNELQTDWADGGRLDLILDARAAEATVAALNDVSTAEVLTQVNAALDTAISELGVAAPTATPSLRTGLMLLYMALRNKRDTTASTDEIHNDAGTVICSATVSDDAVTFTKTEYS